MDFTKRLVAERSDLAEKWLDLLFRTYPEQTQKLWKRTRDPFTNPVGRTFREAVVSLFDLLLEWSDAEAISGVLDKIIRIRAVQDFTPSQAVNFIFLLKRLFRERFGGELEKAGAMDQLRAMEDRIDNLALMAFDVYVKCREEVFEMRVQEVKKSQHKLLVRAGMIVECTAEEAERRDGQDVGEPSNQL